MKSYFKREIHLDDLLHEKYITYELADKVMLFNESFYEYAAHIKHIMEDRRYRPGDSIIEHEWIDAKKCGHEFYDWCILRGLTIPEALLMLNSFTESEFMYFGSDEFTSIVSKYYEDQENCRGDYLMEQRRDMERENDDKDN